MNKSQISFTATFLLEKELEGTCNLKMWVYLDRPAQAKNSQRALELFNALASAIEHMGLYLSEKILKSRSLFSDTLSTSFREAKSQEKIQSQKFGQSLKRENKKAEQIFEEIPITETMEFMPEEEKV